MTPLWFYGALHPRLLKPTADAHLVEATVFARG